AEGQPSLAYAKESVSVPVLRLTACSWKGILFFTAVFSMSARNLLCTAGPYVSAGPLPHEQSPWIFLLIIGVVASWVTSVIIATSGLILRAIISAPRNPISS